MTDAKAGGVSRVRGVAKSAAAAFAVVAGILWLTDFGNAFPYIGPSFLHVPGVSGNALDAPYRGWIRLEADYWTERPPLPRIRATSDLVFTGSDAPHQGPNVLNVAISRDSPALQPMLSLCTRKAIIPELTYAESADRARDSQEFGTRPAVVPAYYEYRLINTRVECPAVENSPERGFVLKFEKIEWLNYAAQDKPFPSRTSLAELPPPELSGRHRTFAVTWFSAASDMGDNKCPRLNKRPSEADFYAFMPPELQASTRAALVSRGGVTPDVMPYRGPGQLNVCHMPGIVPDPGYAVPLSTVARGLNLDGEGGSKQHPDYVSPDGEPGIDNQLYTIEGCVEGFRRKGIFPAVLNQGRIDGGTAILIDVGGIDDPRNDDRVDVTILYSEDPLVKDASGHVILPDYTYRVTQNPQFTQYMARLKGSIRDGVVTTEPVPELLLHQGRTFGMPFYKARLRLEFMPDGSLKGLLGAYIDWRDYLTNVTRRTTTWENGGGYTCPGIYNAARRAADGLRNPRTGEYFGISAAFDIEGVSAFVPPGDRTKFGRTTARR